MYIFQQTKGWNRIFLQTKRGISFQARPDADIPLDFPWAAPSEYLHLAWMAGVTL